MPFMDGEHLLAHLHKGHSPLARAFKKGEQAYHSHYYQLSWKKSPPSWYDIALPIFPALVPTRFQGFSAPENLAPELRIQIVLYLADVASMRSLIRASPSYLAFYLKQEGRKSAAI
jgi:hypothetical protein